MPTKQITFIVDGAKGLKKVKKLRKLVPDDSMIDLFNLMSQGMPLSLACKQCGLSTRVVRAAMKEHPNFRDFLVEAEELASGRIEFTMYKQALDGHFPSQAYILERTTTKFAPAAQRMKTEIESKHVEIQHKGIVIKMATPEDIKKIEGRAKEEVKDAEFTVKEKLPEKPSEY